MAQSMRQFFALGYVAEIIGCSTETLKRRIADGSIKAHKFGNLVRIHQTEIDRIIEHGISKPPKVDATVITSA